MARVGSLRAKVIETPGIRSVISPIISRTTTVAFCGDTLFSLGCGRVFETPYAVMWSSLAKLAALPGETQIYCGHEYTRGERPVRHDHRTRQSDSEGSIEEVAKLRAERRPTVPTTIAAELAANPFLRVEEPAIQAAVGMAARSPRRCSGSSARARTDFKASRSSWPRIRAAFACRKADCAIRRCRPRNSPSWAAIPSPGRAGERREHRERLIERGEILFRHFLQGGEGAGGERLRTEHAARGFAHRLLLA